MNSQGRCLGSREAWYVGCSSQKRGEGGKNNDLDEGGKRPAQTVFEMLGNFSSAVFQAEAIELHGISSAANREDGKLVRS